jgi:hypothetical protein
VIGHTRTRLGHLVLPERSPASGAASQGQHGRSGVNSGEGKGSAGQHVAVEASGRPREAARRVGRLGIQVGN